MDRRTCFTGFGVIALFTVRAGWMALRTPRGTTLREIDPT
jgi:hypothetical protein